MRKKDDSLDQASREQAYAALAEYAKSHGLLFSGSPEDVNRVLKHIEEADDQLRRRERQALAASAELEESNAKVRAYEEKFNKLKEPPLLNGYVLRLAGPDLAESEVVIANGNQILKVAAGLVKKSDLRQGQYVWLHPKTYAVIGASKQFEQGVVGRVVDVMGRKIVVSMGEGFEKKIIDAEPDIVAEMKIGYEVSLLPPTMEILEVRPSTEIRDLFLGESPNVRYAQVGGLEPVLERIRDVVELPYKEPELFEAIKLRPPKGVLLYGPPGCGKTMLGKAVATENDMTFFNIKIADIMSKWVGESENMIKAIFRKARENKPSIIFFDEFDALATARGMQDTAGVHKNIIAQILSEMDGIDTLRDVYVFGATNRPDMIDPALLRPGRFDEVIEIPRPNRQGAMQVLSIYLTPDLPLQRRFVDEYGSKEKAIEALREFVISELYDEDKWVEFKIDPEAKENIKTIKRKDVVSGALIESIVTTAKKNYVKRVVAMPKGDPRRKEEGITREDLLAATEEESKEHALVEQSVYQRRQRERARFREEGVEVM